ncbi:MAG: hypothetical protein Q4F67_16060, partial [Propionibacteriaceae bacterium]|nr:hypothetical protein [Propionibacteriaceae bacterium]
MKRSTFAMPAVLAVSLAVAACGPIDGGTARQWAQRAGYSAPSEVRATDSAEHGGQATAYPSVPETAAQPEDTSAAEPSVP